MEKKNIAALVAIVGIVVAVMVSGCADKQLGLGGAPSINNPEDVVKAYHYYIFSKWDYKTAYELSVDPSTLEPYSEEKINLYTPKETLPSGWKMTYELEILEKRELNKDERWYYTAMGIPEETKMYKITYLFTVATTTNEETFEEQSEEEMLVIQTNEGWRLLGLGGLGI